MRIYENGWYETAVSAARTLEHLRPAKLHCNHVIMRLQSYGDAGWNGAVFGHEVRLEDDDKRKY